LRPYFFLKGERYNPDDTNRVTEREGYGRNVCLLPIRGKPLFFITSLQEKVFGKVDDKKRRIREWFEGVLVFRGQQEQIPFLIVVIARVDLVDAGPFQDIDEFKIMMAVGWRRIEGQLFYGGDEEAIYGYVPAARTSATFSMMALRQPTSDSV
jgi:hypothetical protein